jgi:hypothetical protein
MSVLNGRWNPLLVLALQAAIIASLFLIRADAQAYEAYDLYSESYYDDYYWYGGYDDNNFLDREINMVDMAPPDCAMLPSGKIEMNGAWPVICRQQPSLTL